MDIFLKDEPVLIKFAHEFANYIKRGDLITLAGEVGTGKSTFARALIRYLAQDKQLEVPSPTFTLVHYYDLPPFPLAHADLYRLLDPYEIDELGFDALRAEGVLLVEWPQKAEGVLDEATFSLWFEEEDEGRRLKIDASSKAKSRLIKLVQRLAE
ncbi:tRNA (adenosine(37)-N6)-threonylcarbamoyltransferase complex ATPase subunit type 1 TsaE [Bartonella sp. DGB2]|uniref:tRNA (adenosine(37)-N6)-threonylcarbamoyltransferase complex ATPase subunit type 1 TsaE n=1 Tax=Bartonella sp. DGB2 TaxID=3388426 RepID=UPI00399029E8